MPRPGLPDPQGNSMLLALERLPWTKYTMKHITQQLKAETEEIALEKVEKACKRRLVNLITESSTYKLKQAQGQPDI